MLGKKPRNGLWTLRCQVKSQINLLILRSSI